MNPWYKKSFGHQYLKLYPHRNSAEAESDITAIVSLISPPKTEPLLDLACGAGRHLLALHKKGFVKLTGLDLSVQLLQEAQRNLKKTGAKHVFLVQADMRYLPYRSYFATVLCLFTSFGYFKEDRENAKVFQSVYQCLQQKGVFLIDYANRDYVLSHLVKKDKKILSDCTIENTRWLTRDLLRVEKETKLIKPTGEIEEFKESVRLYSPQEMEQMLAEAGFKNICLFGSLNGEKFIPESQRLIIVTKKSR